MASSRRHYRLIAHTKQSGNATPWRGLQGDLAGAARGKLEDTRCYASTAWTLEPGDVIATGTCGGVAAGMQPPRWLQVGDVVRMEVEGIGYLQNRVVPGPSGTMGCIG